MSEYDGKNEYREQYIKDLQKENNELRRKLLCVPGEGTLLADENKLLREQNKALMTELLERREAQPLTLPHIAGDPDFSSLILECDRVMTGKGHDYTQGRGRLQNFDDGAAFFGCSPALVLGIYLHKHIAAIFTYAGLNRQTDSSLKSEPIEGRIVDAVNYLFLLYKMVQRERENAGQKITQRPDDQS